MRLSVLACLAAVPLLAGLAGCGGPDLTTGMRGGLDSGFGGSYGGYGGGYRNQPRPGAPTPQTARGVYPRVEISMELPEVRGNPFDYVENDVAVTIGLPDQTSVRLPAFYDGGSTWKVRFSPTVAGRHTVNAVTLNGKPVQPQKLEPREFQVSGQTLPGFVRRDTRNRLRFVFDNGSVYYPLGMNVAWGEVIPILGKLGAAGGNWARVWMCHWGGTNLDWVMDRKLPEGTLDLDVARKWDAIVEAAEKAGVYIQVVLQHHGQYSTRVNPNWRESPWNKANGGFLSTPGEFFVHPKARALTQAKYRYILARWGYSTHIMAWEIFNEVEWTDSIANKHADEVVTWHREMARFLRQHDPYKHLVTTSSSLDIPGLYAEMDYLQPHAYPSDALAVVSRFDNAKLDKPVFYGEIGPSGLRDDGSFLRQALWSSIMTRTSGAAQYWSWDLVDSKNWYSTFTGPATFVKQSGILSRASLRPTSVNVATSSRGPLTLRPGGGWGSATRTEFVVPASGNVPGFAELPAYLQGDAHRSMLPSITLKTVFPEDGTVTVNVSQVARSGGAVRIRIDGAEAASEKFAGGQSDQSVRGSVSAKVSAGEHTIVLDNPGADWVVISGIVLDPYAPTLGALAIGDESFGALWVYNRQRSSSSGRVSVPAVKPGDYEIIWYDTETGKPGSPVRVTVADKKPLEFDTPAIATDAAVTFSRLNTRQAARAPKPSTPRSGGRR